MVLATTALLLQFLALPTNALPAAPAPADADVSAPASAETREKLAVAAEPATSVTYTPGRLALEPVAPAIPVEPAAVAPAPAILDSAAIEKERRSEQRQKRIWMGLSIAQSGAATFDAWSTRRVISSGVGYELNPMLRPFAANDSLYAAIQVSPLLIDYVSRRMMTSHRAWARRTWWIPQAIGTAVSLAGGTHNVGVFNAR
jgi:hypothetical protein